MMFPVGRLCYGPRRSRLNAALPPGGRDRRGWVHHLRIKKCEVVHIDNRLLVPAKFPLPLQPTDSKGLEGVSRALKILRTREQQPQAVTGTIEHYMTLVCLQALE